MSKKKAAKAKSAREIRNLPAKALTSKHARGVKGGQTCATGKHYDEATITHR